MFRNSRRNPQQQNQNQNQNNQINNRQRPRMRRYLNMFRRIVFNTRQRIILIFAELVNLYI